MQCEAATLTATHALDIHTAFTVCIFLSISTPLNVLTEECITSFLAGLSLITGAEHLVLAKQITSSLLSAATQRTLRKTSQSTFPLIPMPHDGNGKNDLRNSGDSNLFLNNNTNSCSFCIKRVSRHLCATPYIFFFIQGGSKKDLKRLWLTFCNDSTQQHYRRTKGALYYDYPRVGTSTTPAKPRAKRLPFEGYVIKTSRICPCEKITALFPLLPSQGVVTVDIITKSCVCR